MRISRRHLWISLMWSFSPPSITSRQIKQPTHHSAPSSSLKRDQKETLGQQAWWDREGKKCIYLFSTTPIALKSNLCCCRSWFSPSLYWPQIPAAQRSPSAWRSWSYLWGKRRCQGSILNTGTKKYRKCLLRTLWWTFYEVFRLRKVLLTHWGRQEDLWNVLVINNAFLEI